ncbi:MAG: hypothetical protein LUB59_01430 [Candidatus Gastranaerophilales bacterium]|nr:hypothetical protein [Candidatus Gastranaerophilales bacterium]
MALGFTSHYNTNSEQPFGTLVLANNESETSGSIACTNNAIMNGLLYNSSYDSWEFSVSVNIDYSQYASYVAAASSGSTETAGSVAFSGGSFASAATVYSGGGASFSGGGVSFSSGGGCSTTFTC